MSDPDTSLVSLAWSVANGVPGIKQDTFATKHVKCLLNGCVEIIKESEISRCSICQKEDASFHLECGHGCCSQCWGKALDRTDPIRICPRNNCYASVPSGLKNQIRYNFESPENNQAESLEEMENSGRTLAILPSVHGGRILPGRPLLTTDPPKSGDSTSRRKCHFCKTTDAINKDSSSRPHCNGLACNRAHQKMCDELLECGHFCGGVRGETKCLGCVNPKCNMCVTDKTYCVYCNRQLEEGPSVTIGCGHNVHFDCLKNHFSNDGYDNALNGPISLHPAQCPYVGCDYFIPEQSGRWLCNTNNNGSLSYIFKKWNLLKQAVSDATLKHFRDHHLGFDFDFRFGKPGKDKEVFVMDRNDILRCKRCRHIFVSPKDSSSQDLCEDCCQSGPSCAEHDNCVIVYKCRFCCTDASHILWSTTHFCSWCYQRQLKHGDVIDKPLHELPDCVGKSKCRFWGHPKGKEYAIHKTLHPN